MRSRPQDQGQPETLWARISSAGIITASGGNGGIRCIKGAAGVYTITWDPSFVSAPATNVQSVGGTSPDINETKLRIDLVEYSTGPDTEHLITISGKRAAR